MSTSPYVLIVVQYVYVYVYVYGYVYMDYELKFHKRLICTQLHVLRSKQFSFLDRQAA